MEKKGFIYIWYDRKHKRYYIGCHWGTIDDGYICSSSWMKQAYEHRPQDFKRRILAKNIDRDKLLEEEYKWLQLIQDTDIGIKYYNLSKKHFGHWSNDASSILTVKQKLSEASKKLHQNPEYKEKYIEGRKKCLHKHKNKLLKELNLIVAKKDQKKLKEKYLNQIKVKLWNLYLMNIEEKLVKH